MDTEKRIIQKNDPQGQFTAQAKDPNGGGKQTILVQKVHDKLYATIQCQYCQDLGILQVEQTTHYQFKACAAPVWGTICRPLPTDIPATVNLKQLAAWFHNIIEKLSRTCYELEQDGNTKDLNEARLVLADALEEAGCNWKLMLDTLRTLQVPLPENPKVNQPHSGRWVYMSLIRANCEHKSWLFTDPGINNSNPRVSFYGTQG